MKVFSSTCKGVNTLYFETDVPFSEKFRIFVLSKRDFYRWLLHHTQTLKRF
jgi:hypothetical protein